MKRIEQKIFDDDNSRFMFLSPYSKFFSAGERKHILFREDLHFYIQLNVDMKTLDSFVCLLTQGTDYLNLFDMMNTIGIKDVDPLISQLLDGGIIE